jgi:flagellar protein FliO/FliZ
VIDFWESLFRTLFALAIVLGLMGVMALAARRFLGSRIGTPARHELVHIVASGYVAPRKMISLVSVAGDYLIVGTTATDLVPLGRVSDSGKIQELLASGAQNSPSFAPSIPSSIFAAWLKRLPVEPVPPHRENHGER